MRTKKYYLLLMMLSLVVCIACEKPMDDEKSDDKELYITDDDSDTDGSGDAESSGDSGNPGDSGNSGDSGDSGDSDDSDWSEDSDKTDDRTTPYDEGGIVDGNDDSATYKSGDTITVIQFLTADELPYVYVKGYIVGCCDRSIAKADFTEPFVSASNLLLADSPDETDTEKVMSVELKSKSEIRSLLNLQNNPEMKGRKILVGGNRTTYLGIPGIKNPTDFKIYK